MFKHILSMFLFGGLIGGGFLACGEDNGDSPLPSEGEGQGEGEGSEGEGSSNEGEGEGSSSEGEGEGEGPLPPGGDLEPCGDGNTCLDGYECMTCGEANVESVPDEKFPGETKSCEGRICTCPQWFGGRWWAEFEPRAVGYEYDFTTATGTTQQLWMDQEIAVTQVGCSFTSPPCAIQTSILCGDQGTDGRAEPHPIDFYFKRGAPWSEMQHWITFRGELSDDHNKITGTCDGEWLHRAPDPDVVFHVTCTFTLTRRE